jgi:tetratricopeptide (TPR) repeat protein
MKRFVHKIWHRTATGSPASGGRHAGASFCIDSQGVVAAARRGFGTRNLAVSWTLKRPPNPRWPQWLAVALLLGSPGLFAAQGFIAGSRINHGASIAEISVQLACMVEYVDHLPADRGERLRIHVQSTGVCSGVSPTIAASREQYRPQDADQAKLSEIIYEGNAAGGPALTLVFDENVRYEVVRTGISDVVTVRVYLNAAVQTAPVTPVVSGTSTRVSRQPEQQGSYVINLSSSRQPHAASDMPALELPAGAKVFETEVLLAGVSWYRLRVGPFSSSTEAESQAEKFRAQFPSAWIARASADDNKTDTGAGFESPYISDNSALGSIGLDEVDELMNDARLAMVANENSRAVQLYTKVLQIPGHDRYPQALEYLALAREKNGQVAHAKAEYQRYLSLYPDNEGASRVSQRLATLLASELQAQGLVGTELAAGGGRRPSPNDWRFQTYFSQYYRRDANQQNDEDQIISQSALYSDVNLDVRRRGERYDFSSRISAGYRSDFLKEQRSSGSDLRVSYAYADLADTVSGFRGRIGRQSRNTGGVLGRFDGVNLGYQVNERVLVSTVVGKPAYSASSGIDSERTFFGASVDYGPILEDLELGFYFISQNIEGIQDRQALGGEFRYFGANQSLWGMIDYDIAYNELASAFLQGSWRLPFRLSLHGVIDRRGSPFLSTGNAIIGQPVDSFAELAVIFSEEELRQLGRDRTALSTTYTAGASYPVSPKLQLNIDASRSTIDATPASGGILATPGATYNYVSGNIVASSLLKEGDVSILSARFSNSGSSRVVSLTLDSRFPVGSAWRINPRLRVDRRETIASSTYEWIYTPGMRLYYRRSQKLRFELEVGKQFSQRETVTSDIDRESYFINVGYQVFF